MTNKSKKCGRGFGVGFVPGGGVGPFRCIYFVSGQHSAGMFVSPSCFSFLAVSEHTHTEAQQRALTNSRIRGCVRQARARSFSHVHCYGVCPGRRGGGEDWEGQRDCRRAEARAAVSLVGLLAECARDVVMRRGAGCCCGVRAASLSAVRAHGAVCCVCRQADRLCIRLSG